MSTVNFVCKECGEQIRMQRQLANCMVKCRGCGRIHRLSSLGHSSESRDQPKKTGGNTFVPKSQSKTDFPSHDYSDSYYPPRRLHLRQNNPFLVWIYSVGAISAALTFLMFIKPVAQGERDFSDLSELFLNAPQAVIGLWLIIFLAMMLAMIPSIIASIRRHRNFVPILIINVLLGWTGLFWIACLAWSYSSHVDERSK